MELPADVLPSVDGTVLDPLPTKVNINTNEQIKKTNKSNVTYFLRFFVRIELFEHRIWFV